MPERGLKIVAQFVNILAPGSQGEMYFRGHGDHDWPVIPSAFRPRKWGIRNEGQLLKWRRASSRFANPRPQSDLEWLVLAQHYGVATILLDWTTNPLIALFFASEPTESRKSGAVLAFPRSDFQVLTKPERTNPFRANRRRPALIDTSAMNPRTMAQDSAMSIHCDGCESMAVDKSNIVFEVAHNEKWLVRTALRLFGLSADRLYSDISVAAREFSTELEIDSILG